MLRTNATQERMVECDQGCGVKVKERSLAFHKRDQCERRTHKCGQCAQVMLARDEEAHDAECPQMYVPCKWCGTVRVARRDTESHLATCADYPTYCRYALHGCTNKIVRRELSSHHEESTHWHMALLSEALEDIQDIMGGGGRLGDMAASDHLSGELPLALWPKVQTAMTKEMSGSDRVHHRSYEERIASLESELIRKKTGELNVDIATKHADDIAKLETQNKTLNATVDMLSRKVTSLTEICETLRRESKPDKEALDKHVVDTNQHVVDTNKHVVDIANITANNKKLSDKVMEIRSQTAMAMAKSTKSMDVKVFSRPTEYGIRPTHSMARTDAIVEDRWYRLPVYWSCKLEKGKVKDSRRFYLPGGYRLALTAGWYTDDKGEATVRAGAALRKGVCDGREGMWPWGGELGLMVCGEGGEALGKGVVVAPVSTNARTRPYDDVWGNGHFLIWKDLPLETDQTIIRLTLNS